MLLIPLFVVVVYLFLSRHMREFTLYLSTRWDMVLEREAFKSVAAPALKEILDSRGVSFGYMDVRRGLSVEDLQTPQGINSVLVRTVPLNQPLNAHDIVVVVIVVVVVTAEVALFGGVFVFFTRLLD